MTDAVTFPGDGFSIPPPPLGWNTPHWVRPGERIEIGGVPVESGLFYVSARPARRRSLDGVDVGDSEDCLIHSSLETAGPQRKTKHSFSTTYGRFSPVRRKEFLEWLAAQPRDARAPLEYPLLYLAGLERRVFIDLKGVLAQEDESELLPALHRLVSVYGFRSDAIQRYASALFDIVALLCRNSHSVVRTDLRDLLTVKAALDTSDNSKLSAWELRYALTVSEAAKAQRKLTAHEAAAVVLLHPFVPVGETLCQHRDEFLRLFEIRYAELFMGGALLPSKPRVETFTYWPAAADLVGKSTGRPFSVSLRLAHSGATDSLPLSMLRKLFEDVSAELGHSARAAAAATPQIPEKRAVAMRVVSSDVARGADAGGQRPPAVTLQLDGRRISELQRESDRTLAFLTPIFEDSSGDAVVGSGSPATVLTASDTRTGPGAELNLDDEHYAFLHLATSKPTWSREDLARHALATRLMLDGALETLNGAALDAWDEVLFEGHDPVEATIEAQHRFADVMGFSR